MLYLKFDHPPRGVYVNGYNRKYLYNIKLCNYYYFNTVTCPGDFKIFYTKFGTLTRTRGVRYRTIIRVTFALSTERFPNAKHISDRYSFCSKTRYPALAISHIIIIIYSRVRRYHIPRPSRRSSCYYYNYYNTPELKSFLLHYIMEDVRGPVVRKTRPVIHGRGVMEVVKKRLPMFLSSSSSS